MTKTIKESYSHCPSNVNLLNETIGQNLLRTANTYPNQEALVSLDQSYRVTYKELFKQIQDVSLALLAQGIQKGDRVGIWSPNRYEWVLIQYATAKIGAILVNINPAYRKSELKYVLNQSGVSSLFATTRFKSSDYKKMVEEVSSECKDHKDVFYFESDWKSFLKQSKSVKIDVLEKREKELNFLDPINIQYTSGTTGFPKGATLSHHNILNNSYFIGLRLKYTHNDKVCIPVPFYHCFGMVIGNLCCTNFGATIVIPSESFEPMKTLQAVQDEKCTSLYGVPTMFIAELKLKNFESYDLSSLRTGVMAGSPCPVEVMKQVQSKMYMKEVSICYGMTETSPVSLQTIIGTPLEKQVSTVGTVHDHLEVKIIDPDSNQIVKTGITGELCTKGYSVMIGYWNNLEATNSAIDSDGWMRTGDLAVMDDQGYVNIAGRIKDMIMRGGENIYPREIEEYLHTHELVEDVQVIGVPSEKYGEEVMAWIKCKDGQLPSEEIFKNFCKENIAHYKVPKFWKFVESFPTTVTGKIRKVEMREISIIELNLQDAANIKTS
jgi:fatty-acyl-CoA synthase